jgi:penicillin-binding protein 1A
MAMRSSRRIFQKSGSQRFRNSVIILAVLVAIFITILSIKTYRVYQSDLPSFEQLHNIEPSINTKIYDRNGILLKEFYSENRALTPLDEMPKYLKEMCLASEDQEFYSHWGLHLRRLVMVAAGNLLSWEIKGGASTITQQLARMLFLNLNQTYERKIKEALTAIKLERTYSKDEILEMYLNQHYFSRGAYGVAAAARLFFNKKVSELNLNDCAVIIGLLKGPNINSPLNNPEKSVQARNRVLYSYFAWGGIDRATYDSLRSCPLEVSPPQERLGIAPHFTETVRQYILDKYGEEVLYRSGLTVFTSLDADLQDAAEKAVYKKVDSLQLRIEQMYSRNDPDYTYAVPDTVDALGRPVRAYKRVQGALVAIDNSNGDVLAMVGGRSFDQSKWNRAYQALLQPGSSFKPFLYTAAMDNGFRTTDIVDDAPIVLEIPGAKEWRPHNYDGEFLGPITLRDAFRLSRNLVSARLMLKVHPEEVIFYARRMGITSPLTPVPSLAVGSGEVRLVEMVSAFSTFPNKGIHIPYRLVRKIVDRYGRVLEDNSAIIKDEALSAQTAYIMVDMMRSVLDTDGGTAVRARWMGFTRPAGGKTGTTNNFCDNWFIGYTPQITTGNWVGFDEKLSIGGSQDGARNAVPIWTEFMIAAHDSLPIEDFEEPEGIVHLDVCLESGEVATDRCANVRAEIFSQGTQPTATCHLHPSARLYTPSSRDRTLRELPDTTDERMHF